MGRGSQSQLTLKIVIEVGTVTPLQRTAWNKFWSRLIAEAKQKAVAEENGRSEGGIPLDNPGLEGYHTEH